MKIEKIETDLLCVGGGIASLMAAIRASEFGIAVVVADKGNSLTSGAAGAGNDHFVCYIPDIHGPNMDLFLKELSLGQFGEMLAKMGPLQSHIYLQKTFEIAKLWDKWGIPMQQNGKWDFAGHAFPGRMRTHLKYVGKYQKQVLTKQALKSGVRIINRTMIFELLGGPDRVTGAIGFDTREEKLIEIRAKAVFLGTGRAGRLYPGVTPAIINNAPNPITLTGDGRAMAYRLGAELVNIEMVGIHIGVRYFCRAGQGTWIGVYRDPEGNPLGPYVSKPDRTCGDILPEVDKQLFARIFESGKGPVYMDCRGISDEDLEYMTHGLVSEGNQALVNYFEEEGIDLRKNPIEFMTYGIMSVGGGGVYFDEKSETSIKGLYAAGDELTRGISAAAIFGWIAGENASSYVKKIASPNTDKSRSKINEITKLVEAIEKRKQGYDWKDANIALQQVMYDYAGLVRSEAMLKAGLGHLRRLKDKARNTLKASNRFELIRCVEVMNLYDLGEVLFLAALERKESRGSVHRSDYPLTDPLLNGKVLIVKQIDSRSEFEWREPRA